MEIQHLSPLKCLCTKAHFEIEAKRNSKLDYSSIRGATER